MQTSARTQRQERWRERFGIAMAAYRAGAYDDAAASLREAVELAQSIGATCPELATTYNTLAAVEASRSALPEAEQLYLQALDVWERTVGRDHSHVAATLTNLALLYRSQERFDEAERNLTRALEIDRRSNPPSHPHVAGALLQLAGVMRARGDAHRAEAALLEALEAWPPSPLGDGTTWQAVLEDLADMYAEAPPHALPVPPRPGRHELLAQLDRSAATLRARGRLVDGARVDSRRRTLAAPSNPAATLVVGRGGAFATIAEALAHGGAGVRVSLLPGTYREILVLRESALIEAAGPREDVVIETEGRTTLRVEAGSVSVHGVTLRASGFAQATAVEVAGGSLALESCEVSSSAGDGIEVRGSGAELALGKSTVYGCRGDGVLICEGARADIADCELERNAVGVHVRGPGTALVRSTSVTYGGVGIAITERARTTVQSCEVNNQSEAGVKVSQGANPTFTSTRVRDASGVGLLFDGRAHGLFEDGEVSACSGPLVQITGGAHPRLLRCQFHAGGDDGLVVKGDGGATLANSVIRDMARNGVNASGGSFSLRSCRIASNRRAGVTLSAKAEVELEGCDIETNGTHGIMLLGGSRARLTGSKVTANRKEGVQVDDGSTVTCTESDLRGNQGGSWSVSPGCHVESRGNLE